MAARGNLKFILKASRSQSCPGEKFRKVPAGKKPAFLHIYSLFIVYYFTASDEEVLWVQSETQQTARDESSLSP